MRTFQLTFFVLLFCTAVHSASAQAQQPDPTPETVQTAEAALRQKAFRVLESLASQVGSLQSTENRARLNSNIAGSIWPHDEKRGRALFALVEEDIRLGLQTSDTDNAEDAHTFMVFLKLREDTIERIAKYDGELALKFFRATRVSSRHLPFHVAEKDREAELKLAREVAVHSPQIALSLARQSLARGFTNDVLSVLRQLGRKHKEQAQLLHKEIVEKLKNSNLQDWATLRFALGVAHGFAPPLADDATFKDLINIFITNGYAHGCNTRSSEHDVSWFCREIASLLTQMEKVDPLRTSQLKHLGSSFRRYVPNEVFAELGEVSERGTVDEILALIPKYPQIEGEILWHAMKKAMGAGDLDRARRIVAGASGDPSRFQMMLAELNRYETAASLNSERLQELLGKIAAIPNVQQRIDALLQLVGHVGATDKKSALMLLNQASNLVEAMKPGKQQAEMQLGLAMMYCLEKNDRGFAIMEALLPKLNELVASGAKLDGYDNHYLRDGEWNMTGEGGVGDLLTKLARNAGYFAWYDFDRAMSLSAQFERTEIRLMAQLKLAQGILAGPPKRPSAFYMPSFNH